MHYKDLLKNGTSQQEPLPGREADMVQNLAGGYAFRAPLEMSVRRWLLTGSTSNAFYQNKKELTYQNLKDLEQLIQEAPDQAAALIVEASQKGLKVSPSIVAMVYLSKGSHRAKNLFMEQFPTVIRTASHLYEFLMYTKELRGFGSLIREAVWNWFAIRDTKQLAYQFAKYQSRYGWSARDVLRKFHVWPGIPGKGPEETRNALFHWCVKGWDSVGADPHPEEALRQIWWMEWLKTHQEESNVLQAILQGKLTWEMVSGRVPMTQAVWAALFQSMPITATLRNLGQLTEKEVFQSSEYVTCLAERMTEEAIAKGRIHPFTIAMTHKVYAGGGTLGKSKLRWQPHTKVLQILEQGIDIAFGKVPPTNKRILHALDISSSMWSTFNGTVMMYAGEIAGIMALATIKSEESSVIGGFSTTFELLRMGKLTRYGDLRRNGPVFSGLNFGGTDASLAYTFALQHKLLVDTFVSWTDNETWCGYNHPVEALNKYRARMNPNAKAVYVTMVPYGDKTTLADPQDKHSYDIVGFSPDTPALIHMIADDTL